VNQESRVIDARELEAFYRQAFAVAGAPSEQAEVIANALIEADLRGIFSHGMMLMPDYIRHIQAGGINPSPQVAVLQETPSTALVDGDNGMGHWVGAKAMELAIAKARSQGVGAVVVRNSNHYGPAAYYVMQGIQEDVIAFATTGTNALLAPWGGITPLLGNGPVCFGIPAGEELPVVLDMATSAVAKAKIWLMAREGIESIPAGWAMTKEGAATEDPHEALAGLLMPVGGVKGYGLSVVMETMSAVLSGANLPASVPAWSDMSAVQGLGHFFAAYAIEAFIPAATFKNRMDGFIRSLKGSAKAEGTEEIYLPGEIEFNKRARQLKSGIALSPPVLERLTQLAQELNIPLKTKS
jgi:LDH2 family malate/lactate/ureidoglycolate dehydrogenase